MYSRNGIFTHILRILANVIAVLLFGFIRVKMLVRLFSDFNNNENKP